MRRDAPRPDPDLSALPAVLVVASLAAFVLFVGQVLLAPAVLGALLGLAGAALAALLAVALTQWAVAAVLDRQEPEPDESTPSTVEATPTD